MNLLVLADDDACERRTDDGPADVVIACGDFSEPAIARIATRVRAAHVLAVKGNHDGGGPFPEPIVDLHLRALEIGGLTFGGFGGAWRYKPRGHHLFDPWEVDRLLADFPPVDVFVAHNSPRKIHDREDDVHLGFDAFAAYLERAKPKLFLHGHQHVNRETRVGETNIVGVFGFRRFAL